MVKLRDAISNTKNQAIQNNKYTNIADSTGQPIKKPSFQKKWQVENCAEVWSVRQAIMNGAEWKNISFRCIRAYLKTQKSCIIQTKAKWKQRVRKQETMKQAYHNEQQLCEKL